ncbi:glycosyltransferase family 9 protein [Engelhardtia mirabilis]|uniref:ADP-heptose--LPS heptosyltransferase 2 n=1 Tax=Engelhardtia mirabilis TaxID=2528011 RepID=A0A518BPM1_9BACT|nr:ADP-heptose--LPS heptosyltransferase 2 [Planctomycetes bacterium Pla133]QDV03242.1 ADP-heptose--LPS heptosyltransferase 2 [Planctomycetes bacterium Pla86]
MTARHLVIRAPNWVGDLVMATPILAAALADPRFSKVSIVLRGHLAPVLESGPWEGCLVPVTSSTEVELLRGLGADCALLLSNSFGAALRAWRAGIGIRAGAALGGRRPLLTHALVPPTRLGRRFPIPTAHLLRDVAGLMGIAADDLHPRLAISAERAATAAAALEEIGLGPDEPFVVCCPGAAFGAAKLWPAERFAQALDALHERHGLRALVTGAPSESELVQAVLDACRHDAVQPAESARGLANLAAWIRRAELLLVGDSGPRWFAAAFDVPCVSVMGPNSPELTATSLEWCEVVRVEGLECSPCLERRCPLGHHRCMTELPVERVLSAAEGLLARASL